MIIYAERGNRVKEISEQDIDKYVEQGYQIKDESGRVIKDTIPTDPQILKTAYINSRAKIESLEAEIKALKDEVARLKESANSVRSKAVETVSEPTVEEAVETPIKKRNRKYSDAE